VLENNPILYFFIKKMQLTIFNRTLLNIKTQADSIFCYFNKLLKK
ncbi:MAG: hypothetical protein ACI8PD_002535, partial [Nitrospinales bacterium]